MKFTLSLIVLLIAASVSVSKAFDAPKVEKLNYMSGTGVQLEVNSNSDVTVHVIVANRKFSW